MARHSVAAVHALIEGALKRSNVASVVADSVARALTGSELAGQSGHGLRRVASYCAQAKSGKVDGHAEVKADRAAPAVLRIDAAHGFAYPALDLALEQLPAIAREQGIALAGVTRSHHCGVMGYQVERYADRGLVALMVANSPAAMAPWGGNKAVFGTNPIAFAAPLEGQPPVVVDVSLSKVARGKVMAARQRGESIPEGWAFDRHGEPTTNPELALEGTMAPLGDAKGTALALMVELLAAGLTGSNYAADASSFFDATGDAPGVGQTLIVIDPQVLGGEGSAARFAVLADMIAAQPDARVPGHRRWELRDRLAVDGIEIDSDLVGQIESIGR